MELRDFIVTPILILTVYVVAYLLRPALTDEINRRYFFPALSVKILGALAVGFIYQFYYSGGDTYNFHTHGSRHVWEAFMDSPEKGLKLLISDKNDLTGIYEYSSRIPFFYDKSSYMVIRIAAFFDLFTFSTYSSTSIFFALISFMGSWMLFLTFYRQRPHMVKPIAIATLFIPSVFFWGSGLLKDTITLASLGFATYFIREIFIYRKIKLLHFLLLISSLYFIFIIKKYILLCYLPAIFLWVYATIYARFRSIVTKILLFPFIVAIVIFSGMLAIQQIGEDDPRYALNQLGNTAKITAYDIAYQTGRDAGSTYSLGSLDGSFMSVFQLTPQAINVSLFRPYLWEVRNPLMLISALESFSLLALTLFVVYKSRRYLFSVLSNPDVLFCLVFSLTFSFAVGVSTFNFGTLSRYKIPLLPFYVLALLFILDQSNNERKFSELNPVE